MFVVARVTVTIDSLRTSTNNTVILSLQNLNVMEKLRNECKHGNELLLSYGDDMLGTANIETTATIKEATWDEHHIYSVTVQSKLRDYPQRLTTTCVLSDIGVAKDG